MKEEWKTFVGKKVAAYIEQNRKASFLTRKDVANLSEMTRMINGDIFDDYNYYHLPNIKKKALVKITRNKTISKNQSLIEAHEDYLKNLENAFYTVAPGGRSSNAGKIDFPNMEKYRKADQELKSSMNKYYNYNFAFVYEYASRDLLKLSLQDYFNKSFDEAGDFQESKKEKTNSEHQLKKLIAEGRIEEVIESMMMSTHTVNKSLYNEVVLVNARFAQLQMEIRLNLSSNETVNIERSRIVKALIDLVDMTHSR